MQFTLFKKSANVNCLPTNQRILYFRDCVDLSEILGQGQFGDVYGGHYAHPCGTDIPVAVKTCKLEAGEGTAEKILEEACKFIYFLVLGTTW